MTMLKAPDRSGRRLSGVSLPRQINRLDELVYNLWWTWHPESRRLFERIDAVLWEQVAHNPVTFLRQVKRKYLNAAAQDRRFVDFYRRIMTDFDAYMDETNTWFARTYPNLLDQPIAYFSMEFGLHESLPMYAGGLGVLSGDHLKEASDLGLPLVAVGFLYQQGYFKQRLTEDGWQQAYFDDIDTDDLAVTPVYDDEGDEVHVAVELPERTVLARLWRVQVGRVPLFLLDTDLTENSPSDRELTARLYDADTDLRISQFMVLGIGGVRALRALGIHPAVWHMNEGHSAFLSLERLRELLETLPEGEESWERALETVRATTVFTTHTSVPAGNSSFPLWLMEKYFAHYWGKLKLDRDSFMALAEHEEPWGTVFGVTPLALRLSAYHNGVSELHGQVSREMWHFLWPKRSEEQVPITAITNGVHTATWLARRFQRLFGIYMGSDWQERLDDASMWERIGDIPDEEIWAIRKHQKRQLAAYIRDRARQQWASGKAHPIQVVSAGVLLDPYALSVGFARRFATYKRATLLLRDVERLLRMVSDPHRPVQFIFAGKAHPADDPGKHFIQQLYQLVKQPAFAGRLVFLEDYDIRLARLLVQGVDVWLNTPRRPFEASGTSGEKAAINGVLNLSVLDGWWREGYNGQNGWAIGDDADYPDYEAQDAADCESLYRLLENDVIPLYYERDQDNIPHAWLKKVRASIATVAPTFSTRRMVKEYTATMYIPAMESHILLSEGHEETEPAMA
jgi:starch phosphorylase